ALKAGDLRRFADLMAASHDSQRDDYDVSIPEIDRMVESSRRFGIKAARLTGGGFGGSIVGLVPRDQRHAWWEAIHKDSPAAQLISDDLSTDPSVNLTGEDLTRP
nr:hypothetical protein [Pseudomonadota bacterium]